MKFGTFADITEKLGMQKKFFQKLPSFVEL